MARIDLGGIRTKAGIPGDNLPGWWNRERPGRFEPVGIMVHHDAGVTDKQAINAAVNGRPDLAGPLYASVTTRTGDVIVVSGGRTNHAGLISSAVVSETEHNIAPSTSAKVRRLIDDVSGNELYIGHCIANNGVDEPYPGIQLTNTARFCAAVCAARGWGANRVIGHAEATRRKIDPSTSMAALRLEIAHMLSAGQTGPPAPVTVVLEDVMSRVKDAVDAMSDPHSSGVYVLSRDGGVFAFGGAIFYGSYHDLAPHDRQGERAFMAIEPLTHRRGYRLLADDGAAYDFA